MARPGAGGCQVHMKNTFRGLSLFGALLCTFACAPLAAQVQFQGSLTTNTVGVPVTLASPVYYAETVTALTTIGPAGLSCSTNPVAQVRLKRAGVDSQIGYIYVTPGTSRAGTIAIPSLQVGDVVYGELKRLGAVRQRAADSGFVYRAVCGQCLDQSHEPGQRRECVH